MSPSLGILLMMNNYFHDVATALLLASGFSMWIMVKRLGSSTNEAATNYFLNIYRSVTRLAQISLVWIIIGGIPRTIFYKQFEWAHAAGKNQIPALIIKHILFFIIVGTGAYLWIKLNRKIGTLKKHRAGTN
jgi:hypothetical protein